MWNFTGFQQFEQQIRWLEIFFCSNSIKTRFVRLFSFISFSSLKWRVCAKRNDDLLIGEYQSELKPFGDISAYYMRPVGKTYARRRSSNVRNKNIHRLIVSLRYTVPRSSHICSAGLVGWLVGVSVSLCFIFGCAWRILLHAYWGFCCSQYSRARIRRQVWWPSSHALNDTNKKKCGSQIKLKTITTTTTRKPRDQAKTTLQQQ